MSGKSLKYEIDHWDLAIRLRQQKFKTLSFEAEIGGENFARPNCHVDAIYVV